MLDNELKSLREEFRKLNQKNFDLQDIINDKKEILREE